MILISQGREIDYFLFQHSGDKFITETVNVQLNLQAKQ